MANSKSKNMESIFWGISKKNAFRDLVLYIFLLIFFFIFPFIYGLIFPYVEVKVTDFIYGIQNFDGRVVVFLSAILLIGWMVSVHINVLCTSIKYPGKNTKPMSLKMFKVFLAVSIILFAIMVFLCVGSLIYKDNYVWFSIASLFLIGSMVFGSTIGFLEKKKEIQKSSEENKEKPATE